MRHTDRADGGMNSRESQQAANRATAVNNAGFSSADATAITVSASPIPCHIAVIMDGNGRWAKRRSMPRTFGHKEGAETLKVITRYCHRIGVRYLTVFALSTENNKRPPGEVSAIVRLLRYYIGTFDRDPERDNVKFRFIGDITALDASIQNDFARITEATRGNLNAIVLTIAFNYGGRDEITRAARKAAKLAVSGVLPPDELDERKFAELLDTADYPEPDLLIRTGAELRISNFMLWQSAYSEFWFTDTLWPDFSVNDIDLAIEAYGRRQRRFGNV